MQLLSPITFSSSVAAAKSNLENISKIVGKYFGEKYKDEFINACYKFDYDKVNDLLDKTVNKMTGENSVSTSLTLFALKLARYLPILNKEIDIALSESDKVKVIASHKELKEIIKQSILE